MTVKKTAGALALSALAAFALAACGGGDDSGSGPNNNNSGRGNQASILPEKIEFDVVEELLRPGARVPLEVELEDARDRDVPASGAANVQVEVVEDSTGGAQLSGEQFSTDQKGEARFFVTLGNNAGTVIVKATTDRADNNVANGITDELSVLLGMVVTPHGDGLNWELPTVVEARSGGIVPLPEDADDGVKPHKYSVSGSVGFEIVQCPGDDDVCIKTPAATPAGSYDVTFTVEDGAGSALSMPVTVEVR